MELCEIQSPRQYSKISEKWTMFKHGIGEYGKNVKRVR